MDKKKLNPLARFRGFIQAGATLLTNIHLPNFAKGTLYQGNGKYVCVPGLNCYSCPGAAGACPVGAFQAVVGSSKFRFSYYITGILILFGVLLGRFICGFLCPFGWFQELLHKIPSPKLSTKKLKPLRYLKYAVLLVMVVLLPLLAVNELGMVGEQYLNGSRLDSTAEDHLEIENGSRSGERKSGWAAILSAFGIGRD